MTDDIYMGYQIFLSVSLRLCVRKETVSIRRPSCEAAIGHRVIGKTNSFENQFLVSSVDNQRNLSLVAQR